MEVYMAPNEGQTEVTQGVLGGPVFLCRTFPGEMPSVQVWKTFPTALVSPFLSITTQRFVLFFFFPVLRLYECSQRVQKNQNSRCFLLPLFFFFFASVQFCIEKYVVVSFFKSTFLFFLNPRCLFLCLRVCVYVCVFVCVCLDPELVSVVRSYMCWASIMSKYLASMI